jgi:signal transduction histidine kinase
MHHLEGDAMSHAGERLQRSALFGYGLALVSVGAALLLSIVLLRFDSPIPFTGFALTAIAITFWCSSTKPGILAVLLSTLARSYFFRPAITALPRMLYDSVFLVFALLMIWLTRERNDLEAEVAERTAELARANEGLRLEILDRKRVEEALRSSERQQHQIASQLEKERARLVEAQDVAKVGSWEAELQTLNVIWSEQTHRIFETEPSSFHPTRPTFREFVHPDDRAKVDAAFVASLDTRSPCTVDYRIVLPDGRVKILEERWRVFHDEEGKPVRVAGTCRDITERVRTEEELQRLTGKLLRLQDEERQRIARDLHDSTGQDLVALATMLGQLRSSIPSADQESMDRLSECNALVDVCIRDVRTLSYLLHPPVLDQAGLGEAICEYVDGFTKRSGIQVELELSPHLGRIAREVELALFRVVQEALTNVQRHSGSQQAKIRVHRNSELTLEISDLGLGVSADIQRTKDDLRFEPGVGILSMQERVKLVGGRFDIQFTTYGTTVHVTIPLGGERT